MANDKMREEFEAWHGKEVAMLVLNGNAKAAYSLELNKDALLYVWKASRESLVIDLTNCVSNVHDGGAYYAQCMIDDAIEAAGLKVKL